MTPKSFCMLLSFITSTLENATQRFAGYLHKLLVELVSVGMATLNSAVIICVYFSAPLLFTDVL